MSDDSPQIHQIPCVVRRVQWILDSMPCDRCQKPARRVWSVTRTAVDIDLNHPVLLAVTVSVHHCGPCRHYFRVQPPFLRPDSIYANRVVQKAVEAVFRDGPAWRRVGERLARDFWVHPSEKMIRRWCAAYAQGVDFDRDYLPWVVETFSDVLCVDEVYQGKLVLLLAVDPAGPDGDRLVGYQLVEGTVDQGTIATFLQRLQTAGIRPDQIVTDGAAIYPPVLAQVWPAAAHQLCLFHETRRVTTAVDDVAKVVRKGLPTAPPAARLQLGGRKRGLIPPEDATDSASKRWRWRRDRRRAGIAQVHALREWGLSLRAIARETGLNRRTVMAWLKQERPGGEEVVSPTNSVPPPPTSETAPPPAPWVNWEQVRTVRSALKKRRSLLLRRPEHLDAAEAAQLQALLDTPIGADLRLACDFLTDWYAIWRDEEGRRRDLAEAQECYEQWRANAEYARLVPLRRIQQSIDAPRFRQLSHFLRNAIWEATNNGAERMGRAFRHRQGPHFNLRTTVSIEAVLKVRAYQHKETSLTPAPILENRCSRGRPSRLTGWQPTLEMAA